MSVLATPLIVVLTQVGAYDMLAHRTISALDVMNIEIFVDVFSEHRTLRVASCRWYLTPQAYRSQ